MLLHDFNFYIYSRRQIQVGQGFNDFLVRIQDVNQTLVHPELKLLPGVLVNESRAVDRVLFDFGRQRNRTYHLGVVSFRGFNNLARGIIDELVVVSANPQSYLLRNFLVLLFNHELVFST